LQHRQTSGNAPLPHFVIGSKPEPCSRGLIFDVV
jgi:hypothetical protein